MSRFKLQPAQAISVSAEDESVSRRRFGEVVAAMAVGSAAANDGTAAVADDAAAIDEPVRMIENPAVDLYRVRMAIAVEGNVDVPVDPLASRKSQAKLPITSDAVFDYEERYRRPARADRDAPVMGVERYYHEAASEGTLNKTRQSFVLRPEMRSTLVRRDTLPELIYCPDGYFNHEELGLLRSPVSSVSLGDLLPEGAVIVGDQYVIDRETMRSVLNLSTADAGEVQCKIESIDAEVAKISLKGRLDGSVDGVPTLIRLVGKLTFDRKQNVCTWLALAVHETREIGKAEPGFDVSATIRVIRQPMASPVKLAARPVAMDLTRSVDSSKSLVQLKSDALQIATLMDRRWRMITDRPGNVMMRMIDHESSLGQCNVKPLVKLPEGKTWTMRQLEQDVRRSLGKQLTQMVRNDERVSPSGVKTMQLIAAGRVEGVEVRWIVQHLADDSGRRVLATFTTAADSFAKIAGSEIQFSSTLEFLPQGSPTEAGPGPGGRTDQPADVTTAPNRKSDSKRIATDNVESASDRR